MNRLSDFDKLREFWVKYLAELREVDFCYPASCDWLSKLMIKAIKENGLFSGYDVRYVRGHYVRDLNDVECPYLDEDLRDTNIAYLRQETINGEEHGCQGCSCDEVTQHSYIEIEKDGLIDILDFTAYQFVDEFNSSTDVEPEKLISMANPVIVRKDVTYKNYFPTQKIINVKDDEFKLLLN